MFGQRGFVGQMPIRDQPKLAARIQGPRGGDDKGTAEVRCIGAPLVELEAFVQDVKVINILALVITPPGNAHGVGRAIDLLGWPEVEGSIAGDDTVLIVTRTSGKALEFRRRLGAMAGRSFG